MPIELLMGIMTPRFHQDGIKVENIDHMWKFKIYRLSCFIFALNGILKMKNEKTYGTILILQSFLSYMSDVHTLGIPSKWHMADRYFALCLTLYRAYIVKNMRTYIFNTPLIYAAYEYLRSSQKLYDNNDIDFLVCHIKWHIVAALLIFLN